MESKYANYYLKKGKNYNEGKELLIQEDKRELNHFY